MARVRAVASLGLAARNLARLKVRQPLSTLYLVRGPLDEEVPEELWALARAELNVRAIELVDDLSQFQKIQLSPDLSRLGPSLGPMAPEVARALAKASPSLWETLSQQGWAELSVKGEPIRLEMDDVRVEWIPAPGFVVFEGPEGAVALDVRLTDELRAEGDFRELVHRLQLGRKEAGFAVTDRIEVAYQGEIGEIFRRFQKRIQEEVLAVSLREGDLPEAEYEAELEVHGRHGRVALCRSPSKAGF
jgi:isoleucyl-tRNA synthetase